MIARPHFSIELPPSEWQEAKPGEGVDLKLVSPDGNQELLIGVLVAPNEPDKSGKRLQHVFESFLASNRSLGQHTVVDTFLEDELGPTNEAGFTLDFGATVIRRRIFSVLATPALFGERGRFQLIANVGLYTHHPDLSDGERRFDQVLRGLHVAPGAYTRGLGVVGSIDETKLFTSPISRAQLNRYASVLASRGVSDPTRGLWPLGHDLFCLAAHTSTAMPRVPSMLLARDAEALGLSYDHLLSRGFENVAARVNELVGRRLQTPAGQTVLVFHGHHLSAAFMLLSTLQASFAEQLGTNKVLACFPRPDLTAIFADVPPTKREEIRTFIMAGAGDVDLSDRVFELSGGGGARPIV